MDDTLKTTSKDFFLNLCTNLVYGLDCKSPNEITIDQYYDELKKFPGERIKEIFHYLRINHPIKTFPILSDFYKAARDTNRIPEYRPERREDINLGEYSKDILALAKKFTPPKKVNAEKNKPTELYMRMLSEKKIYSIKLNKWVAAELEQNIGGEFVYPHQLLQGLERGGL